jgi:hypothetical protein
MTSTVIDQEERVSSPRAAAPKGIAALRVADDAAARRTLRAQIAKLERELAVLATDVRPRDAIRWTLDAHHAGPRLLGLGELERTRDELAERLHAARVALTQRAEREALKRDQLQRMLRDPARHRFVRITRADVGEPGCGAWESRPRFGVLGLLMDWWQVKVSSGCPLARAAARRRLPRPTERRVH